MSGLDLALLVVAGVTAGSVNAAAGGGSLISFPALLATGLPALDANVTNTVATWPGYVGSATAYRAELRGQRRRILTLVTSATAGAVLGSVILLVADESVFDAVVPGLILASCALLAAQGRIVARVTAARTARSKTTVETGAAAGGSSEDGERHGVVMHLSMVLAGAYGAYFGGGLGVILLAVLGSLIVDHLQRINAARTVISLAVNAVALVIFVFVAPVDWAAVAVLAPSSLAGGYVGGRLVRRLDPVVLRALVITLGVVVAVALAVT